MCSHLLTLLSQTYGTVCLILISIEGWCTFYPTDKSATDICPNNIYHTWHLSRPDICPTYNKIRHLCHHNFCPTYNKKRHLYYHNMRALARVLWLFFNSREVHFGEEFYPTDDVVCFISPKTVFKQLKKLWYLILFTFMFFKNTDQLVFKVGEINWFSKWGRSTGFQSREILKI